MLHSLLTHWGRGKIDTILQTTFSNAISWMKMFEFRLKFHWSFPKGPINNMPVLVQIMAWRRTGDKPLSEPMMAQFNDAYMRHSASMSLIKLSKVCCCIYGYWTYQAIDRHGFNRKGSNRTYSRQNLFGHKWFWKTFICLDAISENGWWDVQRYCGSSRVRH